MGCLIQSETKNPSNYEEYNRYNSNHYMISIE